MTSPFTPDRFTNADWRRFLLRSRPVFAIVFALILIAGISCILHENATIKSVGASLIASAIVSLATLWIEHIRSGEQIRAEELLKSGLRQAFTHRNLEEYAAQVEISSNICVTGYTLRSFIESNESCFHTRARNGDKFKVQMLLVDPACEIAKMMEAAEKQPPGSYERSLISVRKKLEGLEQHVELRLLNTLLPMMIYRIDDVLYTGPYPYVGPSRAAPTLKLAKEGWLFTRCAQEFEALWNFAAREDGKC